MMQMTLGILALSLVAMGSETSLGGQPAIATGTLPTEWVKTEIYFGCNLPDGQQISLVAWAGFMDTVLTPRFPKGLTVYEAYGQMQHADGKIAKQSTWVVVILHAKDPVIDHAIREVTDAFRKQFNKAQVVTISTPVVSANFYAD